MAESPTVANPPATSGSTAPTSSNSSTPVSPGNVPSVSPPASSGAGASTAPHQPGKVLARGNQTKAMQEQLGALQQELSQIFTTDNKGIASLMDRYVQDAKAKTSFFDHLKHLTGLGRSAAEQADGAWGNKTTRALVSIAYVSDGLEKLSRDLGQNQLQGISKSLDKLINNAKSDPANAEKKYAPEIGVLLMRLQKSMELIKNEAAEASKHLNTALETKLQQKPRSGDLEAMIYGGRDTGLKVSDPVLKYNNMPISFAALKDMVAFKAYLRQQGILGPQDAEGDNTHMRTIITSLIQQTDREIDELKHTALTLDQKGKKNYTTTGPGI